MPYWVYGLRPPASADPLGIQSAQPQPADPVIIEADSEDAARALAQEMGPNRSMASEVNRRTISVEDFFLCRRYLRNVLTSAF
jgi:hypothetical protein